MKGFSRIFSRSKSSMSSSLGFLGFLGFAFIVEALR
jgi:hypothetical protein